MPPSTNTFKTRIIINPISGKGNSREIAHLIEKHLDPKFQYEICYTTHKGHAIQLSKEAAQAGYDLVVAVGGDGTVHEVGKQLIGTSTALAIIPTGSGNGLACHCNIPRDPEKAIALINQTTFEHIDTVRINEDHFLNLAGVGFDAHVAQKFAENGKRGLFTYVKLSFGEYFSYKEKAYELSIDGKTLKRDAFFIGFANSSQHGANIRISPHSCINDGLLDVVIMRPFSTISIPSILYHLLRQKFYECKFIEIFRAKEVKLKGAPMHAHLDGEPVIFDQEIEIRMAPQSLKLLC